MNDARPIILKLGGSAITDKAVEASPRNELINRLATEIKRADLDNLIIVHGGGSFGHPIAARYNIKEGYNEENLTQKFGYAETHHMMTVLNGIIMDAFILHEMTAISVAPANCIVTKNGKIKTFDETALKAMSKLCFTPVMYGDTVMDEDIGFTILSGDQLVTYLALKYNAEKIVVGVDTDGIFEEDPKVNPEAKPIKHLNLAELKALQPKLGEATGVDVTGGMAGKIAELIPAVEAGIPITVTGATKGLSIYRALTNQSVLGTVIEKT
ncbi:MAG: isopentenyl phosphate kinase [Candidatus Bathyarchaeota archaeon]|nr:isopentenyl phosphate kinase [Candidatus Termiticorpusculum sp.]